MHATRPPAVAGRFYPSDASALSANVQALLAPRAQPERALAVLAPHAGYVFSGAVAGETYGAVAVPASAVVICPNHTGRGVARSLWSGGAWQMPGGAVPIDESLRREIGATARLVPDRLAHELEHGIEVHLPFLQRRQPRLSIVPICLGAMSYEACKEVGLGLARALAPVARDVLIVASSDMSHYVSASEGARRDRLALACVEAMDPEGLHRTVRSYQISMCGVIPATVALVAALELGAQRSRLVRYTNSGEVSGDFNRVVGYAGMVIS
jgi:AmmeMemoRadiSam system protein B